DHHQRRLGALAEDVQQPAIDSTDRARRNLSHWRGLQVAGQRRASIAEALSAGDSGPLQESRWRQHCTSRGDIWGDTHAAQQGAERIIEIENQQKSAEKYAREPT